MNRKKVMQLHQRWAALGVAMLRTHPEVIELIRRETGKRTSKDAIYSSFEEALASDALTRVDTLIVVGHPLMDPQVLQRTAKALWRLDPTPLELLPHGTPYPRELQSFPMADGGNGLMEGDTHPDFRCASLLKGSRGESSNQIADALDHPLCRCSRVFLLDAI